MNRKDTNGKNTFNVGDEVYIIESNRNVRKVTIIKISRDFCTVRFADTDGAIAVRVSRLYGTRKMAEESLLKKLTVAVRQEGPRPPHNVWM